MVAFGVLSSGNTRVASAALPVLIAWLTAGLAPTAPHAAEPVPLRSADVFTADAPSARAVKRMDELLRERTNNRVTIESIGAASKDSEAYIVNQVRNGQLDMARINIAVLGGNEPAAAVLSLPYLFRSRAQMRKVLDGPIGEEILAQLGAQGLIGLCFYDAGARSFYSRTPIRSAADMKDMTVQVPTGEASVETVKALGAKPVTMPYAQIASALQTGAIDAVENTWSDYLSGAHYRTALYYSVTEHSRAPGVLIFSKKVWDGLSSRTRTAIRSAAKESVPFLRDELDTYEASARKAAAAAGSQIIDDVDRTSFTDALVPLRDRLLPDRRERELVQRIRMQEIATAPEQGQGSLPLPK